MCSSTPQTREELRGVRPLQMRPSGGQWSSPHRPGRSTTDENGSPVILRPHETHSPKSLSSLQAQVPDPVTPPQPSSQSPCVFRPVVPRSSPTRSAHFFTPVASSAAVPSSKSTNNNKPVTTDDPSLIESGHNYKPIVFDGSRSPKSPHDNKPLIIEHPPLPVFGHKPKPSIFDEPKSPTFPSSPKSILVSPGSSHNSPHKSLRKSKSVSFEEPDVTAGPSAAFADDPFSDFAATGPPISRVNSAPAQYPSTPMELPPEARFLVDPRSYPFKVRYRPYVPRAPAPETVTFPNGLDGNNPYPRPYGGGWSDDPYHAFDSVPPLKLLVDPYANPYKQSKKQSRHNYYGGRSAAQRESTRHVHRAANGNLVEEYEMDDLSVPKLALPNAFVKPKSKTFIGTAVSALAAVRRNVKVTNVKPKAAEEARAEAKHKPKPKPKTKAKSKDWPISERRLLAEIRQTQKEDEAREKKMAKELKKAQKGPGLVSRWKERREEHLLARARRNYEKDVEEERKRKEKAAAPSSPPAIQPDNDLVEHHEPAGASEEAQEEQRALDMEEARRGKRKVSDADVRRLSDHIARKAAEQLSTELYFKEQGSPGEEESLDITPPRLRTPIRSRE